LGKVVSYLEANYLLALHSKADKGTVEKEAHLYLNEALARVATDKVKALLVAALKFIPLW
jgi:hypothetical protein